MIQSSDRIVNSNRRIAFIDLAKCVALALIIVAHTQWEARVGYTDNFRLVLFWICAGYTSSSEVNLLKKSRLLVSYALMSVLCLLYSVFYAGHSFTLTDIFGIFYARFSMMRPPLSADNPCLLPLYNSVLWFLPALFTSYCVFKVIMKAKTLRNRLVMCAGSLVIGTVLCRQPYLLPWSADMAFIFAVFLCAGHWMRRYRLLSRMGIIGLLLCLPVYAFSSLAVGEINLSISDLGHYWPLLIVSAISGATLLMGICRLIDNTWVARMAVTLNSQALYIFGLQLVFISLTDDWLAVYMPDWRIRVLSYIVICFACGFAIGNLFKLILKK